jgi:hypothetical protein
MFEIPFCVFFTWFGLDWIGWAGIQHFGLGLICEDGIMGMEPLGGSIWD